MTTLSHGSQLGGTFRLQYDSTASLPPGTVWKQTAPIAWDASEIDLQQALQGMSTMGQVAVSRELTSPQVGGYTFTITFLENRGDLAELVCDDLTLRRCHDSGTDCSRGANERNSRCCVKSSSCTPQAS